MRGAFIALAGLLAFSAWALPVSYQGKLTDLTGVGVNDTVAMALAIYDAPTGGTLVDADTVGNVVVCRGLFSAVFDLNVPPPFARSPLFIQVSINSGGGWVTLAPRQPVNAEFRAMWADHAIQSDSAFVADTARFMRASDVAYDHLGSGLFAATVQGALDELADSLRHFGLQKAYDRGDTVHTASGRPVTVIAPYNGGSAITAINNDDNYAAIYARNDSTGPAIYCSGDFRISGASSVRFYSTADVNIQVDRGGGSSTTNHFRVRDDADNVLLDVSESGVTSVIGLSADSIELGGVWRSSWPTGGGTVNDSDFIWNQDTVAQPAKFWVEQHGSFGVYMAATEHDIWTDDFEDGDISDWDTTDYLSGGAVWTIANPGGLTPRGGCTGVFLSVDDDYAGWGALTSASAISPVIDLSPYVGNPIYLEFNHWYNHYSGDVCSLFVYDGTTWQLLATYDADDSTIQTFDISAYANANFQIKFKYDDGGSWAYYWMVDNIRIYYITYSTPAPSIVANGSSGNLELNTPSGDVLFDGVGLRTSGGAAIVGYDNSASGLSAANVQEAIDELKASVDTFGSPGDYIRNQISSAQTADFWISGAGRFGDYNTLAMAWSESFEDVSDSTTPPAGWDTVTVAAGATEPMITYEGITKHPYGYSPAAGTLLVRFNSYTCSTGSQMRLFQTAGTDMTALGYTSPAVVFDMFHDDSYPTATDNVVVQYSTDGGTTWNDVQTYYRYSSAGDFWETIYCYLPASVNSATDLRIGFLFTGDYGNDVYIDNVRLADISDERVIVEAGSLYVARNVYIGGKLTVSGGIDPTYLSLTPQGSAPAMPTPGIWVDDGSPAQLHFWDGTSDQVISGGGGGGGCVTLDGAYDCGGSGAGRTIVADAGAVEVNAVGASNGALSLFADDASSAALYVSHSGGGNGIWNDGNYWSPSGNVALGSGVFHSDNGLFQSNGDFICRLDVDNDGGDTFRVQNSVGTDVFTVDEAGNAYVPGKLTVVGGVDPTYVSFTPQSSAPSMADPGLWSDGDTLFFHHPAHGDFVVKLRPPGTPSKPANVITVALQGGDYTSISAALAAISSSSDSLRWVVEVKPGKYVEGGNITVPAYVQLRGVCRSAVVLDMNGNTITLSSNTSISGMEIRNAVINFGTANCHVTDCVLESDSLVLVSAASNSCIIQDNLASSSYIYMDASNPLIEGNEFTDCQIIVANSTGLSAPLIANNNFSGYVAAIMLDGDVAPSIIGNRFELSGAFAVDFVNPGALSLFHFEGNFVSVGGTRALNITNQTVFITSNTIIGGGIWLDQCAGEVSSNVIKYSPDYGVYSINGSGPFEVISNVLDSCGIGITVSGPNGEIYIKDNKINTTVGAFGGTAGDGIRLLCQGVIEDNIVVNAYINGIWVNAGGTQILRNFVVGSGTSGAGVDLNSVATSSVVASYNVLDSYTPAGTGAFSGAFNTQSNGTIWTGGSQPGQLP